MKSILLTFTRRTFSLFVIIAILFSSCKKNSANTNNGTFTLTTSSGKKYVTTYVNVPIPTVNGTFSLQYNKPSTGNNLYQWQFFILIDNNNDADLSVWMPTKIQNGVLYTTNTSLDRTVDLGCFFDNSNLPISTSDVTFSSSDYPGHVKGVAKGYASNGTLLCTGEFDFNAQ